MTIQSLEHTPIDQIIACFLKSFKGYFVKMPADPNYYKRRWKSTGVQWDYSYGMFVKENLVGFILTAIDSRNGDIIAYNAGTGVLPEFRNQRIVRAIYKYAIPKFKDRGISKCVLEVIKENHIAIKSYQSIGFNISKGYKCFGGEISGTDGSNLQIKELSFQEVDWTTLDHQEFYSWDNHRNSLKNGDYRYFQVLNGKSPESFFAMDTDSGYVAQIEVFGTHLLRWERVFKAISTLSPKIKINNIDERLTEKIDAIVAGGLKNTVDQYEMELDLLDSN